MRSVKKPVPDDLMARYREFNSLRATAEHYDVSPDTVSRWVKEMRVQKDDNAKIIEEYYAKQTTTHRAMILKEGQVVSVLEVCEDYVKIRLPWMINHIKVPERILEKIPVREDD